MTYFKNVVRKKKKKKKKMVTDSVATSITPAKGIVGFYE